MEMRIKAPGARTYLQIIQARFDRKTHLLYIVFALITNAIVSGKLLKKKLKKIKKLFKGTYF